MKMIFDSYLPILSLLLLLVGTIADPISTTTSKLVGYSGKAPAGLTPTLITKVYENNVFELYDGG